MSSQQSVNCDTYSVEANTISFKSNNAPTVFHDITMDGILTITNPEGDDLAEPNLNMRDHGWIGCKWIDVQEEGGITTGYMQAAGEVKGNVFTCNGPINYPPLVDATATRLIIYNSCDTVIDNSFTVTGPFTVTNALFMFRLLRINGLIYYDLRMNGSAAVTFTATNATITTESKIATNYRPHGLAYGAESESTVIPLQALINGVIVNLMGQVRLDGTMTITRPGGTFTSGETFYLLEASGTWITL